MYRKYIIVLLLYGCENSDLTPPIIETICKETETLYSIESSKVCGNSMSCMTGSEGVLNKYFCVCDILCLCFYASSKTNEKCIGAEEKGCKFNSFMAIVNGDFCSLSKDKRNNFLIRIKNDIQTMENESESNL